MLKVCPICNKEFIKIFPSHIFCSKKCYYKNNYLKEKKKDNYKQQKNEYMKIYKSKNIKKMKEIRRRTYLKHLDKDLLWHSEYYLNNQDIILKKAKKWRENNKIKSNAHSLSRKLKLDINSSCEICGSKKYLVKHHPDYNKPLYFKIWCQSCHMSFHTKK